MNVANFDTPKRGIEEILAGVRSGETQLPDFQRGWVWDDHHIKDLIASVSLSFPIGAIMTLKAGGDDVSFKPRPIEGAESTIRQSEPDTLVLDGQQRLTSLFQALMSGNPVSTKDDKGKRVKRWYYLDMKKCVSADAAREDAVISVSEDRRLTTNIGREVTLDLSSPEQEYANDMFPLHQIFNSDDWQEGYIDFWDLNKDKWNLFKDFNKQIIKTFEQYQVPVIELSKDTPKEAVCIVFEKVNQGGVSLTVFELLTASFAADDFELRKDWDARQDRLKDEHPVLREMSNTLFLQAVTLLATKARKSAVGCSRRVILSLKTEEYKEWADKAEEGFKKAAQFLHGQKIFKAKDIPYQPQLVPLATILTDLEVAYDTESARQKIIRWFWCGVLGEMYSSATETRFANDFEDVARWVRSEGEEPRTIRDANFQANRLLSLRTRNSAAYKGIHALLMRDGSRDFRTGVPIEDQTFFAVNNIDIHHIFPQAWCKREGIDPKTFNSIINKTAISAGTNRRIGGRAPSAYLDTLQRNARIEPTDMDEILASHRISSETLRDDDFDRFFADRAELLLQSIETAMGKNVAREDGLFGEIEDYDDGPRDWDENVEQ